MPDTESARFLLALIWQQLWIGTTLVGFVAIGLQSGRRWNAATRHWIWATTLLVVALLPLGMFLPRSAISESPAMATPAAGFSDASQRPGLRASAGSRSSAVEAGAADDPRDPSILSWLASGVLVAWLIGVSLMLARLIGSARVASALRRRSSAARLPGVGADVRVSRSARSPMVVGLLQPAILVPASLFDTVPAAELNRLLAHELAHLRRRDHWIMLIQRIIEAVYFFHPAVRFAARRLDDEREISCDDRAAAGEHTGYAMSLVRICRNIASHSAPAALAVGAVRSPHQLTRRIAHLLDRRCNHAPEVCGTALAVGGLALVTMAAVGAQLMPRTGSAAEEPAPSYSYSYGTKYEYRRPLLGATGAGDTEALSRLVESGASLNAVFPGDGTALIAAARRSNIDTVRWLLDHGADVNLAVEGDGNPLIMAAARGRTRIVRLLLDRGADIDAVVRGDENALISAARRGQLDTVRLLLERGAKVDTVVPEYRAAGNIEWRTALNQAESHGHEAVARLLVQYGAIL